MSERTPASTPPSAGTCPLCLKYVGSSFLPLHASACDGSACGSRTAPRPPWQARPTVRRTRPQLDAPPSERGAPGFHVFEDVLSEAGEAALMRAVESARGKWTDFKARRVASFGPPWSHAEKRLLHECDGARPTALPGYVADIVLPAVRRVVPRELYDSAPNQLCVAVYRGAESFILPHSDEENDRLGAPILGLSLQAGTTMTLSLPQALSPTGGMVKADVWLPPRSLYVMSGDALSIWHHGIFAGKTNGTRYSLTLRLALPPSTEQHEARKRDATQRGRIKRKRLRQSRLR
jgi:alkylated DNA repair dioxygenase AlkB